MAASVDGLTTVTTSVLCVMSQANYDNFFFFLSFFFSFFLSFFSFFLSFFLRGDVAICVEASDGPNAQPHIPEWVENAVRLLQASIELVNACYLVPRIAVRICEFNR